MQIRIVGSDLHTIKTRFNSSSAKRPRSGEGFPAGRPVDDIDYVDDIDDPRTEGPRRRVRLESGTHEGARKPEGGGCDLRRMVVDVVDVVGSSKAGKGGKPPPPNRPIDYIDYVDDIDDPRTEGRRQRVRLESGTHGRPKAVGAGGIPDRRKAGEGGAASPAGRPHGIGRVPRQPSE